MYGKVSVNRCSSCQKCADFLCHQVYGYGGTDCCVLRFRIALCGGLRLRDTLCVNIQIATGINSCSAADLCVCIAAYQRYRNCCVQGIILSISLIRSTLAIGIFVCIITSFHISFHFTVDHRFHSEIACCFNIAACNFCICRCVRNGQSEGRAYANTLITSARAASAIAAVSGTAAVSGAAAVSRFCSLKVCACTCLGGNLLVHLCCHTALLTALCCQVSIHVCSISSIKNIDCSRSGYAYVGSTCTGNTDHFDGIGCFFSATISRHSCTNQEITGLVASGNLCPVH